ncbi:Thermonuclease precursor [Polystyrenella longa]|uniref:Thermonuclease n=1 Tax=Polystyrenella longa TaxID=2528007 RepID=A0A518CMS5_9PLAN|nr:thermonuclease family protein [Polystyrenella longa]QDU80504.1 Thermonuclease precursor [Polystyrenella longa]
MRTAIVLAVLIACSLLFAEQKKVIEQLEGKVVGVTDGDTVRVLVNRQTIKVRLEGIDAPESGQSFGTKSKQALSKMIFNERVIVKKTGEDQYERTLGIIFLKNANINAKMVEDGWAWHYKKYNSDQSLSEAEIEAKKEHRGLWEDDNPIPPWEFRTRKRKAENQPTAPDAEYWLNTSSNVRHNQSCEYFKNTKSGRECSPDDGKACGICGG